MIQSWVNIYTAPMIGEEEVGGGGGGESGKVASKLSQSLKSSQYFMENKVFQFEFEFEFETS